MTSSLLLLVAVFSLTSAAAPDHQHHHHHHEPSTALPVLQDSMLMDQTDQKDMDLEMNMDNQTHDMMKMYFHFGVEETILFKEWRTTDAGGMAASVMGVFVLGMLYEGLKYFRDYLFKKWMSRVSTVAITGGCPGKVTQLHKVENQRIMSLAHAMQTALHVLQIIISYFLMLIFMTYNVWLCLGVVLGSGCGYFVFGWLKTSVVDITEHCH